MQGCFAANVRLSPFVSVTRETRRGIGACDRTAAYAVQWVATALAQ
jgi:hypothetical protein